MPDSEARVLVSILPVIAHVLAIPLILLLLGYVYLYYSTMSGNSKTNRPLVTSKFENVQKKFKFSTDPTATLGQGCFGIVRQCHHWRTCKVYACKTMSKSKTPADLLQREVQNLQKINGHPYLLQLIDVYEDVKFVHVITEVCRGGELYEKVLNDANLWPEVDVAWLMRNILLGIAYLHTVPKIVHRDLKASNFLFVQEGDLRNIKIIDFGLSKHVPPQTIRCEVCRSKPALKDDKGTGDSEEEDTVTATSTFETIPEQDDEDNDPTQREDDDNNLQLQQQLPTKFCTSIQDCDCHLGRLTSKVGTPFYVAPEIMKQESYTNKCDVWSIGCIAYFVLSKKLPIQGETEKETIQMLQNDDDESITRGLYQDPPWTADTGTLEQQQQEDVISPLAQDFCQCLLQPNPLRRPSAEKALHHPWLIQHCGRPPSDLRGDDDEDDDSDDEEGRPRWGAVSRFGARIATDRETVLVDSSGRSNASSDGFFGKLFRKTKSSYLP